MNNDYDIIIIGSGICASHFRKQLDANYRCLIINPIGLEKKFEFINSHGPFSPIQADKGDSPRGIGAVEYWGGAITWPTKLNYFKDTVDKNWNDLEGFIRKARLNYKFNQRHSGQNYERFSSIFPKKSVIFEKHGYLGGAREKVAEATNEIVSNTPHINAEIQEINLGDQFELTIGQKPLDSLQVKVVKSTYLILASGALLNPLFYSMISHQRVFKYGNHLSLTSHTLEFEDIQVVGAWAQTYSHRERSFNTFLPRELENKCNQISTRMRPKEILSKKRAISILIRTPERNYQSKIRNAIRVLYSFAVGKEIATSFTIDLMVNQKPNFGSHLIVEDAPIPKKVTIDSKVDEECLDLIRVHMEEMDSVINNISKSGNQVKSVIRIEGEELRSYNAFRDAAHWYGTIPMDHLSGLVDSNLESRKFRRLFAIGSSSFVEGSVGHPTLLAMHTAGKAAQELNRRLPT